MTKLLEITKKPSGEEPNWVRKAWTGLVLPYKDFGFTVVSLSVLGHSFLPKHFGVFVPRREAMIILGHHSPKAAIWWKQHYSMGDNVDLIFSIEEIKLITPIILD